MMLCRYCGVIVIVSEGRMLCPGCWAFPRICTCQLNKANLPLEVLTFDDLPRIPLATDGEAW